MKKDVMKKWVKALRNPKKYTQTDGCLRDDKGFCCLGVLCDVLGAKWKGKGEDKYIGKSQQDTFLPEYYRNKAGMKTVNGELEGYDSLDQMNDEGDSFDDIAKHIEKNYKEL